MTTENTPATEMTIDILSERMPLVPESQWNDEQRAALAELTKSRGGVRGPFCALMRNPKLMDSMQRLGGYIRFNASLNLRVNRVASLLTARHYGNQYEWATNVPFAQEAGLAQQIIDAIGEGRRPSGMAADEEVAYDFTTEVLTYKNVCDITYAHALKQFGESGVIDLLAVIGYYGFIGLVMNVARTAVPGGKPLPLAPMPMMVKPRLK